jgi:hypothetical protein
MEDGWPKGYCEDLQTKNQLMFYGKPLQVAYASPRGERSRLVPESVARPYAPLGGMDRMRLLEEHLDSPLDRSRVDESPRQGEASASDRTTPVGPSSEISPKRRWERYGFKENR